MFRVPFCDSVWDPALRPELVRVEVVEGADMHGVGGQHKGHPLGYPVPLYHHVPVCLSASQSMTRHTMVYWRHPASHLSLIQTIGNAYVRVVNQSINQSIARLINCSNFHVFATHQNSKWRVHAAMWCVAKFAFVICSATCKLLCHHTHGRLIADAQSWLNLKVCMDACAMIVNNSMRMHLAWHCPCTHIHIWQYPDKCTCMWQYIPTTPCKTSCQPINQSNNQSMNVHFLSLGLIMKQVVYICNWLLWKDKTYPACT